MKLKYLLAVIPLGLVTVSVAYPFQNPAPVSAPVSDAELNTQVNQALAQQHWPGSITLVVRSAHGSVRVSGAVDTQAQAEWVEDVTSRVQGVRDVTSSVHVREPVRVGGEF